ncbi:hypothetical protein [Mesorhizobium sp. B1-1-8]|uniref:hypothetical protein n=1 Tax=Mesorhizobium sp. B1-1-8 TaxID=2589976 RepID=UPI001129D5D4|nr:hypothetical protein [Mesorhizobium sp. B1-1-8]UCI06009.1 hypothetical protein FJ974_19540 [Mesorhizobium sp. B1-1-8]
MADEPKGKRFSHVYMRHSDLLPDSERLRNRLATLYSDYDVERLGEAIEREIGIQIGSYKYGLYWPNIMRSMAIQDVLDSVTLRFNTIAHSPSRDKFLSDVRRVFAEEQIRYRIDDLGGVHFAVDSEFERMRVSTIAVLGASRFRSVREQFESAFLALDKVPPDGKAGIRAAFFATEGLFRLMFPTAHQLSVAEVQKHLKPSVDKIYEGQKPAIYLAHKQLASFMDWIDGAHFYRHEPGTEEPAQPPLELAVYSISQAGGHIRWLAQLGKRAEGSSGS